MLACMSVTEERGPNKGTRYSHHVYPKLVGFHLYLISVFNNAQIFLLYNTIKKLRGSLCLFILPFLVLPSINLYCLSSYPHLRYPACREAILLHRLFHSPPLPPPPSPLPFMPPPLLSSIAAGVPLALVRSRSYAGARHGVAKRRNRCRARTCPIQSLWIYFVRSRYCW